MSAEERHEDVIRKQKPLIFAVKHHQRIDEEVKRRHFCGCKIYKFEQDMVKGSQVFSTGTAALRILTNCENFTCDCYCFSFDADWKKYIDTEAKHYGKNMDLEERKRHEWIEMLSEKRIFDDSINPVICVRKGSSLKDKNIRPYKDGKSLLEICIEKVKKVFGSVTVLADDEHYCELAKSYGAEVPYLDEKVSNSEDVTVRLRRWRDRCGINGRIILFQCTSPNLSTESMEKMREMSKEADYKEVIVTTVVYDDVKHSALLLFDEEEKYMKQAISGDPQISKPRQELKPLYHYNGAMTSFACSQLSKESLFDDGNLKPCMIEKWEGLDIDTIEQFNR